MRIPKVSAFFLVLSAIGELGRTHFQDLPSLSDVLKTTKMALTSGLIGRLSRDADPSDHFAAQANVNLERDRAIALREAIRFIR